MSWLRDFKLAVLMDCYEEHEGLWSILWLLRHQYPSTDSADEQTIVLRTVEDLLESGLVVAGSPASDWRGFTPWTEQPSAIIARVKSEWEALGRDPTIGEIVWFTTSPAGDRLMRKD